MKLWFFYFSLLWLLFRCRRESKKMCWVQSFECCDINNFSSLLSILFFFFWGVKSNTIWTTCIIWVESLFGFQLWCDNKWIVYNHSTSHMPHASRNSQLATCNFSWLTLLTFPQNSCPTIDWPFFVCWVIATFNGSLEACKTIWAIKLNTNCRAECEYTHTHSHIRSTLTTRSAKFSQLCIFFNHFLLVNTRV